MSEIREICRPMRTMISDEGIAEAVPGSKAASAIWFLVVANAPHLMFWNERRRAIRRRHSSCNRLLRETYLAL
jgi:hypothetical protein